jgi:hypothetical protein
VSTVIAGRIRTVDKTVATEGRGIGAAVCGEASF